MEIEEKTKLNYHWYILSVQGGKEEKVNTEIKLELFRKGGQWLDYIQDLKSAPKILKGYVICYCHLTQKLVKFFYQIPRVISFLNHKKNELQLPDSVSEVTVQQFFSQLEKKAVVPSPTHSPQLCIGDLIRITEGAFTNYEGKITYLDEKKHQVKVTIDFFNQEMTFDLPMNNCQKVLE